MVRIGLDPLRISTMPQWFKPLVKNGQNFKEFEYMDVVYVLWGFRPWEFDFQEKNEENLIFGAQGAH